MYRKTIRLFVAVLWVAALSACKTQYPWMDPSATEGAGDDPDALAAFGSSLELEQHLKRAIREQGRPAGNMRLDLEGVPVQMEEDAPGGGDPGYSTTNLQEIGVDEADRLKSDGRHLYLLSRQDPVVTPLGRVAAYSSPSPEAPRLRIMELATGPESAREIASLGLREGMRAEGSYLLTGRAGGESDLLVVIGRDSGNLYVRDWFSPWPWRAGATYVELIDVDEPSAPRIQTELKFDGHLVASRRVGEKLYLVTRHYPWIKGYRPAAEGDLQQKENRELLDRATLSQLLPGWEIGGGVKQGYLASSRNCYLSPAEDDHISADIISIIAVDLRKPEARPVARCLVGPTETVYMSRSSLYLATTRYRYTIEEGARPGDGMVIYPPEETTLIHKFALTDRGPVYRGSAAVKGHLGWEQDKKPFRMGERDDVLFVATSIGTSWERDATTHLTVLTDDQTGTGRGLREIAHLPNEQHPEPLGAPGERLYAARFLGERGYLVTFRVTDPLYVLNLSDPADPFVAGELKISGYSDYLHPVTENMLLGIGKAAIPSEPEEGDGRGAWYQGVKLALFDVSDPQQPKEVDSVVIGGRGTDSDALHEHHAVTWLPANPDLGRPARLALPVSLHAVVPTFAPMQPWEFYPWTHTGLYLFDIYDGSAPEKRKPGIVERGQMVVESAISGQRQYYAGHGDRALLRGDGVHYLHGNAIWSATWGDPGSLVGPQ